MKIGINMLLWTGHVEVEHVPILKAIKAEGYDGVEIPVFDVSDEGHYRWLAGVLDDIGLERTVVALIPDEAHSPISEDPACRTRAVDHLKRVIDCTAILSGQVIAGPWFQPLGVFSGDRPSEAELDRCAAVHRQVLPLMRQAGIAQGLEPLNRFEAHLLNTCEQAIAYAARIGEGGIGILYDTFHANIEERDPIAALHALHASGNLVHVHISENDRGTPGHGHAMIRETIHALRALGYDQWLTIEAFGRGVPELAAATRVWRNFFESPEEVYREGISYIRQCWDEAA
ncbi:isomerase [Novosphingobium sp. AAP83]|uniref:sugar phosphate isomerase/epimerase family protein n=1 Tax=Novosphingobium sp. AAP83 TaxID=1523425 RepID=UPI0006B8A1A4|nr:sugar phosphate isomerase/epimerase [Novosphingobium sp. AAP83]KPF91875.1 isomerase [Novosphingobium sp. AAP83]